MNISAPPVGVGRISQLSMVALCRCLYGLLVAKTMVGKSAEATTIPVIAIFLLFNAAFSQSQAFSIYYYYYYYLIYPHARFTSILFHNAPLSVFRLRR